MLDTWLNQDNRAVFEHARSVTAQWSKSFYMASGLLPREKRWATYALYGFCRFADNLVDNPRFHRSREELVQEVDTLAHEVRVAHRTGESEHPVVRPYIQVAGHFGIPSRYALDLLKGVTMDLDRTRYATFSDLYTFCYRVAAVVGLMMTHVLGYRHPIALRYAEELGIAMQLTNILRDVKEDAERGRIYLPLDELERFGVREEDILAGRMSEPMRELMRFQVQRARCYYESAERGIALLDRSSRFAITAASRIYSGILTRLEENDFNPFLDRFFVSKSRKLSMLFVEYVRGLVVGETTPDLDALVAQANRMRRPRRVKRARRAAIAYQPPVGVLQE